MIYQPFEEWGPDLPVYEPPACVAGVVPDLVAGVGIVITAALLFAAVAGAYVAPWLWAQGW